MSDTRSDSQARTKWLVDLVPWLALAVYAALLVALRPVSPTTPEEGTLLLALRSGEAWAGAPPAWWLLGRGLVLLRVDPFLGWQVASVLAWALGVVSLFRLWARLAASSVPAWLAAAVLATWPPLVFRSAMATPEAAGVGLSIAAVACLAVWAGTPAWVGYAMAAGAVAVLPRSLWMLLPVLAWAAWRLWCSRRRRTLAVAAGVGAGVTGVLWGAWWVLGPSGSAPAVAGSGWLALAGSPWLGLGVAALAVCGGLAAWSGGRGELVGLAAASITLVGIGAVIGGGGAGTFLLAAPWLALLVGAVGLSGGRGRWWGAAAAGAWGVAALVWTWPAVSVRRDPAPAWAAFGWARQNLEPARTTVVFAPNLQPFARLLLEPGGFRVAASRSTAASEALAAGHHVVIAGPVAEVGGNVLKAWRWPSGRVQRLVSLADSGCVLTRRMNADRSTFSRAWRRDGGGWELTGEGTVSLDADADARRVVFAPAEGRVEVRTAGFPPMGLGPKEGAAISLLVYPGPAGAVSFRALTDTARFYHLQMEKVGPKPQQPDRKIIPQAAAASGIGGSLWQTDLTLVNPEETALTAELMFLPSDQANSRVRTLRVKLDGGESRQIENVLNRKEFLAGPRTGALVVRAAGCPGTACGILAFSRTYNTKGESCDPIGEGLPGLGPASGLRAGQHAVFEGVANNNDFRGYLGFASWCSTRSEVHAVLWSSSGEVLGEMYEGLEPWSHRHLRLPRSCSGARLEVEVRGQADALVFPYLSTVQSARNCSEHRYPDRVEGEARGGVAAPRDPELLPVGGPNG